LPYPLHSYRATEPRGYGKPYPYHSYRATEPRGYGKPYPYNHGSAPRPLARIGRYSTLKTLAQEESIPFHLGPPTKTPAEAVADILELRKGVKLGGLEIKDLIHEGHKY